MYATNLVASQILALIGKFETGEIGQVAGNELLQQDKVRAVMRDCICRPYDDIAKQYASCVAREMHKLGLVTHQFLQRRLLNLPMFRDDPIKATPALKRAIESLAQNGEIQVLSSPKARELFGYGLMSYQFAEYKADNLSAKAFFADSVGVTAKANMK